MQVRCHRRTELAALYRTVLSYCTRRTQAERDVAIRLKPSALESETQSSNDAFDRDAADIYVVIAGVPLDVFRLQ